MTRTIDWTLTSLGILISLSACAAPRSTQAGNSVRVVNAFTDISVFLSETNESWIEIRGNTCLENGWLEQIVCSPNTREHESLVVTNAKPSDIHAALLTAGFESSSPGKWTVVDGAMKSLPPTGDQLDVIVRYTDSSGAKQEHRVSEWIRDHRGSRKFPNDPWVFGGSRFEENPEWMGPGEHYVADQSGSIIGLVTFGDEVIGYSKVIADQVAVQPAEWEVDSEVIPPVGTDVTIILRRIKE